MPGRLMVCYFGMQDCNQVVQNDVGMYCTRFSVVIVFSRVHPFVAVVDRTARNGILYLLAGAGGKSLYGGQR